MNALPAHLMSPVDRRQALCNLLALGLLRLHMLKQVNYMTALENVQFTSARDTSLMQLHPTGESYDDP